MPRPRRQWYVGVTVNPHRGTRREAFTSAETPTPEAYPYAYVVGPFHTGRAARLCERVGPHPVLQHVRDFERLARYQEVE